MRHLVRRAGALAAAAAVALGGSTAAAAPTGVIQGRVIDGATGRPVAGVELVLTTGTSGGDSEVVDEIVSNEQGRYRFAGLATGEDRFYALDATHEGGLFAGRPVSLPSDTQRQPVIRSTMRVWDTTTDPAVIAIERDDMFVVPDGSGVGVIESVTIFNASDKAYIGRGAGMIGEEASGASFAFALPSGSEWGGIIDSTLDIPEMVKVDRGLAATIAIPPGKNQTTFSFRVPGTGGSFDLSRSALYPTLDMSIYAAAPLEIRSNRLSPGDDVTLENKTYRRWSASEPIEAGDPLQALAVAQGSVPWLPFLVVGGGLLAATGVAAAIFRMRRRTRPPPPDRNRLMEQVAELDLAFEAGDIDRERWDGERSALVGRLRELQESDR